MTFLEAAERVLKEANRPMKPAEIVKVAIEKGWLASGGRRYAGTLAQRI